MPNYTREELANKTALTNQMRNNLYHFLRYLNSKGLSERELRERLERMGKNIAQTILDEKDFLGETLEDLISNIYREVFESKVQITQNAQKLLVEDKKCPLCKYKREDLSTAPCLIINSLITEICTQKGYKITRNFVKKSVALGDITCLHVYISPKEEK
jgi:hypothetical protein